MSSNEYDLLIVGQGLAGSLLAIELINRGQRLMVIDNQYNGSSTQVAAGLINPITGHRLNITESFELYSAKAREFYRQAESQLSELFFQDVDQIRRINNAGQANYCTKRLQQDEYRNLLAITSDVETSTSNLGSSASNLEFSLDEFGCVAVKQTAVVNTKALLSSCRDWLQAKNAYTTLKLDYAKLKVSESYVSYGAIKAKRVVFCEGYQAIHNPWLKDLPFKLAKGEILTVNINKPLSKMLSWGNWLVPGQDSLAKLGSNFAWNDLSLEPSNDIKQKLLASLHDNTTRKGEVISHEVGIRPTTAQRKPFVGKLTNLENAYCFNGLGSKGCLIAPYYSALLADHLINGKVLPTEVTQCL